MGYRAEFLTNVGSMARHNEVMLHVLDREVSPSGPIRLLVVGVENGGAVELWQRVLPEGSEVLGLDRNPACAVLPLPVEVCDVADREDVSRVLKGRWFDAIIDCTDAGAANLWPYLRAGGLMILERVAADWVETLVADVHADRDSVLPVEEVLRVNVFPGVAVVEKRNPRVVPYLDVMCGNFCDVVGEGVLRSRGVRLALIS